MLAATTHTLQTHHIPCYTGSVQCDLGPRAHGVLPPLRMLYNVDHVLTQAVHPLRCSTPHQSDGTQQPLDPQLIPAAISFVA